MKGLLIKDMKLMLGQKRFFLIVMGMGIMLMFSGDEPAASMGYVTMLITIFSLNTISYDEHENGMSFLMTLPITRKTYVQEKYAFAVALATVASALSVILVYVISMIRHIDVVLKEVLIISGVLSGVSILIFAITLPLMVKFGSDKGRIALFAVFAVIGVLIALLAKLVEKPGSPLMNVVVKFSELSAGTIAFIAVFAMILTVLASYFVTVKIISRKEY